MFALKNCKQLRCEVQGQTTYICLPCILCCSFIDFDPFSGFRDLLNGCKIVVCHSSTIHNESTRSPWIGRLRRTGAIFSLLPEFTFKICFFATNYGILHYIKTCTSQNFKPCFVHSFSLFVQTTKQTLNSWNAQEILPGPHFFPVILLTPARHPVQVHWRQQGLYHPIRLSRRGHQPQKFLWNLDQGWLKDAQSNLRWKKKWKNAHCDERTRKEENDDALRSSKSFYSGGEPSF